MSERIKLVPHVVSVDDDGIRPAGRPDECLYCRQRVGARHLFECVTVTVQRTYRVILDGEDVGKWSRDDPASWDREMRRFHKNESSWCAGNLREQGILRLNPGRSLPPDGPGCLCDRVELTPIDVEPEYEASP